MAGGRPRAFATADELQQGIDAYIAEETANEYPVTVSGLAYALGVDRTTLFRYANGEHEFCNIIKSAIAFIEADKAKKMLKGQYNTTAAIFDLTNNHGWRNEKYSKADVTVTASVHELTDAELAAIAAGRS